ncbi:sensor domain-containing diguanylate cyclase [Bosea sp. PAMC 26642]|uniref:sensor domain-containing diguanylate cyclase n=1 Tax=Bosea sp. (strain PAMC 26642) TaxID=1792307 RepID=UPI00076FE612|nr:diguanylate cyclase [Bosea sp. PAMC 26642]AMJ60858.1 hypothetical protein AXW83_11630 [Bosea sp. PAMC 26642]
MIVSRYLHDSLDMLGIAACEYDAGLKAVGWNRTFLQLFPEHDGAIVQGEPYRDNLRRFYRGRLSADEMPEIERYIAEGVARHDNQTQPFEFIHRGRLLRASSLRDPDGGRVRMWQRLDADARAETALGVALPVFDALSFIPDGATILDADDRIIAANDAFRRLYDVAADRAVVGISLDEIIAESWRASSPADARRGTIRNGLRYDGAPVEVELPGQRWRRVIARHSVDGIGCFTHADITAAKRQQMELLKTQEALRQANAELAKLAETDGLTGLANHRRYMRFLAEQATGTSALTVMMIDADHFKTVNDRFGHLVGDHCLKLIASTIAEEVPAAALVARVGGEEFGVVLGGVGQAEAMRVARAIRYAIARAPWHVVHSELGATTVSIGICSGYGPLDGDVLHARADDALYAAKRNGRNRIEVLPMPVTATRRSA